MVIYQKSIIKYPRDKIVSLFWDIRSWSKVWSPIEEVEVSYDDGLHQEFVMHVWRDDCRETVRTIRFKTEDSILFFTPLSPPMMKIHNGAWKFTELSKTLTCIEAYRNYELKSSVEETSFQNRFSDRISCILEVFRKHFETSQELSL